MDECPACDGRGCDECGDTGQVELSICPLEFVTADVWDAIRFAGLYEKGLPPVAGGTLDQCNVFLAAVEMIWAEQERWKQELR